MDVIYHITKAYNQRRSYAERLQAVVEELRELHLGDTDACAFVEEESFAAKRVCRSLEDQLKSLSEEYRITDG